MIKGFIAYDKAVKFNKVSRELKFPYSTKDQFVRAAESIALNLAEGSAKGTKKDQRKKIADFHLPSHRPIETECNSCVQSLTFHEPYSSLCSKCSWKAILLWGL